MVPRERCLILFKLRGRSIISSENDAPAVEPIASVTGKLRNPSKSGYLPTLDGWRTLAVFSVIAFHDTLHQIGRFSDSFLHSYGNLGVDLFFAISGVLICSRLLDEEHSTRGISLKGFYVRRFCRILPPACFFLATLGILGIFHVVHVGFAAWLSSLLFFQNYYSIYIQSVDLSIYTNHFWSLAIEEHFYLLLPGVLYLFPIRRTRVLAALIAGFFTCSVCIYANPALLRFMGGNFAVLRTGIRINALLFPALLAILLRKPGFRAFCLKWLTPLAAVLLVPLALAATYFMARKAGLTHPGIIIFLVTTPFGFPFLIVGTMLHPRSYISRFLELAPLRYFGRISYSIYLWQQLFFIGTHTDFGAAWPLGVLQKSPWNFAAVIVIASSSYYLLEKPFIRLGHRLAPPVTPGRGDLEPVSS